MMRNCKGITLTALAITIIVLIIISTITILASTNLDIIGQARQTSKDFDDASLKQILDSIYLSEKSKYNSGLITEEDMWTNIVENINNNTTLKMSAVRGSELVNVSVNGVVIYKITMDNGVKKVQ